MKADALNLTSTLNSAEVDYYTIPQYQRPYTWVNENFEVLWEDLLESYNDYNAAKSEEKPTETYFLGPVVFVKNTVKRSFDIIDGQQRVSTFHIILWYLYRRLTDTTERARINQILTFVGAEPKLKVSSKDATTFLQIRESNNPIDSISKMADCANFFRLKIAELTDPKSFSEFLRENTQFIVIVADDYAKAWDLFIGINGKGEPLNPTDLVKAFVCGQSEVGDQAGAIWEENILPLGINSTAFLLFLTRFQAKKYISENALFREICKLFPSNLSTLEIAKHARIFNLFWLYPIEQLNTQIEGLILSQNGKKSLRILRDLARRDFTTLIFQYHKYFGIKEIFDESFLNMLVTYQMRMSIARKRSREKKFIGEFKEAIFLPDRSDKETLEEEVRINNEKLIALNRIKQFLSSDAPDDKSFEGYVKLAGYHGNYPARIILRDYEEGKRGNKMIIDYQIEHLMPESGTPFWYKAAEVLDSKGIPDKTAYANIVNNIGNLFIIDATTNNQVKNFDYLIKKGFYQEYLIDWSIARITLDKESWITMDIDNRAIEIARWARNNWKF